MDFSFELLSFNAMVSNNLVYPYSFAMIFFKKTREVTVNCYIFIDLSWLTLDFDEEHVTNIIGLAK